MIDKDYEEELIARFGEALSPLIDRFGYGGIDQIGILMARLRQDDPQAALYLLKISPSLIDRLLPHGEELILNVYELGNQMVPFGSVLTVRLLEMSPEILEKGDYQTLVKTASLAREVARENSATAVTLIQKSPDLLESIGFEGLEKIGLFSAAIARSSRTYSLKALEQSTSAVEVLLKTGGKGLVLTVYDLGMRLADEDWSNALEVVKRSPAVAEALVSQGNGPLLTGLYEQASRAASFGAGLTLTLLDTAPSLIEKIGPAGLEPIWGCALAMAAENPENAQSLFKESPDIVQGLLSRFSSLKVGEVYELGKDLARISSQLALGFLEKSVDLAERLDDENLKHLLDRAKEMAEASLAAAGAFLQNASALIDRVGVGGLDKIADWSIPMARQSFEAATRFLQKSPELIDRLGLDGVKTIGDFSALLAQESETSAIRLIEKCPSIIDGLLKIDGLSLIAEVCRLGGRIARTNARLAVSLLEGSSEIIGMAGFAGLEKVEELAHQVGLENWTAAVSLVEASPRIIKRVGFEGLERIAAVARKMARVNSYNAVNLLEKCPDLIDRLLHYGDQTLALHVYDLAGEAVSLGWRMASILLERSPEFLSSIGADGLEKLIDLVNKKAEKNLPVALGILDKGLAIMDRLGFEGLEIMSDLSSVVFKADQEGALSLLENGPLLIDRLENTMEGNVALAVYDLAAKVARTSPAVAMRLLEKSPEFLDWVGFEGFGRIAAFVENAAKADEEKALSFLKSDSPAFADFMENIPKGLELKTVKPVLSIYLKALLGRRVEIAEADMVYTDGQKIYLPRRIKEFQDREDNFALYKVSATHQEAHLEYGSFEFDLDRIGDSVERLRSLYGEKAGDDESDIDRFVQLFPEPDLARDLFNIMEDFRIEGLLKREYPALGKDITRMNLHKLSQRRPPKNMTNPKQRAVEMIGQSLMGGKTFDEPGDPAFPILQEALERAGFLERSGADVHDAARIAAELTIRLDREFKEPYRPAKPMAKPLDQDMVSRNIGSFGKTSQKIQERISRRESAGPIRPQDQPEAESGSEAETQPSQSRPGQDNIQQRPRPVGKDQRTFQGPVGGGKPESGGSDTEAEETGRVGEVMKFDSPEKIERLLKAAYREQGITPKEIERRLESLYQNEIYLFLHNLEASLDKKTELQSERGTSLYPEWGEDIQEYRGNWARVREQTLAGKTPDFYRETLDRYAGLLKKIRREFQILKPEGFVKLKRQYDGDDIDLDAVVEYWVDRKAGLSPGENNYTLTRKKRRDIAVAFLIDMSRSTKGATIEREKESLIIMSEALHEVGDSFAVFGFSGDNRDNVDFYRIKGFDDPYDDPVKKRISAITDRFENRDGTAIRHTVTKLRRRPERTKLIILLSDGKPVDKEYTGLYAIEDTRMALKEAQHFGIKTFCITVDRTAAEYLPRMYSHSSWTVIDDVIRLPEKITRIYRGLTA